MHELTTSPSTPSACSRRPSTSGSPQADRAVCNVRFGTSSYLEGEGGDGPDAGTRAAAHRRRRRSRRSSSTRRPGGLQTQGDPFEPVKIGILVDMDLGQLLADWIDPTILAIEDALNEGVYDRSPVEIITVDARGLPRENYRKVHRRLPVARRAGLRRDRSVR